jgi:hypothetical protein
MLEKDEEAADDSSFSSTFRRDTTSILLQAVSNGNVPGNNNESVAGVSEESNWSQNSQPSTYNMRRRAAPRNNEEDSYCLNINFEATDESGVSSDYVYYNSIFSSRLSHEA